MSDSDAEHFQQASNSSRPSFIWDIETVQKMLFPTAPKNLYPYFFFRHKGGPNFFKRFGCFPCELIGKDAGKPGGGQTIGMIENHMATEDEAATLRNQALAEHSSHNATATLVLGLIATDVDQKQGSYLYVPPTEAKHSLLIILSRPSPQEKVWTLSYLDFTESASETVEAKEREQIANNRLILQIWQGTFSEHFPVSPDVLYLRQACLNQDWKTQVLEENEGGYCWALPAIGILLLGAVRALPPPLRRTASGGDIVTNWNAKHKKYPLLTPIFSEQAKTLLVYLLTGERISDKLRDAAFAVQHMVSPARISLHDWHWGSAQLDDDPPVSVFEMRRLRTLIFPDRPQNLYPLLIYEDIFVTSIGFQPQGRGGGLVKPLESTRDQELLLQATLVLGLLAVGTSQLLVLYLPSNRALWFLDFGELSEAQVQAAWNRWSFHASVFRAESAHRLARPNVDLVDRWRSPPQDLSWMGPVIGFFLLPVVCQLKRPAPADGRRVVEAWNQTITTFLQPQTEVQKQLLLRFLLWGDYVPGPLSAAAEGLRKYMVALRPPSFTHEDFKWLDLDGLAPTFATIAEPARKRRRVNLIRSHASK